MSNYCSSTNLPRAELYWVKINHSNYQLRRISCVGTSTWTIHGLMKYGGSKVSWRMQTYLRLLNSKHYLTFLIAQDCHVKVLVSKGDLNGEL